MPQPGLHHELLKYTPQPSHSQITGRVISSYGRRYGTTHHSRSQPKQMSELVVRWRSAVTWACSYGGGSGILLQRSFSGLDWSQQKSNSLSRSTCPPISQGGYQHFFKGGVQHQCEMLHSLICKIWQGGRRAFCRM
ncbi:hypothetical protein WJX75_005796 [Coccomyxa subellipsoidea]|uniref:Uncharacterized protein n=1 Tax=Coccomyxa subellipsoidea TaxID=248742 RepID=A0ABR2YI44_9CHLO